MVKSSNELKILSCANIITKEVLKTIYESGIIKIGVTETELKLHVSQALTAVGLRNIWYLVLFGPNAAFPHGTSNNLALNSGDFILFDIGGELLNYQSDISRTIRFEKGSEEIERAWYVVQKAQTAGFEAIKPGVKCSDVDAAARKVVDDSEWGTGFNFFCS